MFVLTTYHPDQSEYHPEVTHWREFKNAVAWGLRFMSSFDWEDEEDQDLVEGVSFYASDASGGSVTVYPIEAMEDEAWVQKYLP